MYRAAEVERGELFEREKDGASFCRCERDEDTLANDTSATELVRDALDSDQKRKTELAEVAERTKERKARSRRRGSATQTEAEEIVEVREKERESETKGGKRVCERQRGREREMSAAS